MKMIIRHLKVNILLVENESGGHYEIDYYIFEQEIIFILSRPVSMQNRNFRKRQ